MNRKLHIINAKTISNKAALIFCKALDKERLLFSHSEIIYFCCRSEALLKLYGTLYLVAYYTLIIDDNPS